jgi:hypothetical protein
MLARGARYTDGVVGLFEGWDVRLCRLGSIRGNIKLLEIGVKGDVLDRVLSLVLCIVRLSIEDESNTSASFLCHTRSICRHDSPPKAYSNHT